MTIDLTDTTTGAIHDALTQARRRMGGPASGMVLTLIIVTNEEAQYDAVRAAAQAGREHPSRVLAVIPRKPRFAARLDAEIRVGETGPGETVLLRLYGPLAQHADSVVAPLLVPDVPVVTWWPDEVSASPVTAALGAVAQRRVTDAAANDDSPHEMLLRLAEIYRPGDTDLSWTRATSWRSLLAATLDQPYPALLSGRIEAEPANPSADLIAAWLRLRLTIPVTRGESPGPGITSVSFDTPDGEIKICRPDGRTATLSWPGRPDRRVALHRRDIADLIAEELRRLEPDELYGETLRELAREPVAAMNGAGANGAGANGAGANGAGANGAGPNGTDGEGS